MLKMFTSDNLAFTWISILYIPIVVIVILPGQVQPNANDLPTTSGTKLNNPISSTFGHLLKRIGYFQHSTLLSQISRSKERRHIREGPQIGKLII